MSDWFLEDFVLLQGGTLKGLYAVDFFVRNPQVSISLDLEKQNDATDYSPFGSTVLVATAVTRVDCVVCCGHRGVRGTIELSGWKVPAANACGYGEAVDFRTLRADISASSYYAGDRISSVLGTLSR